MRYHSLIRVGGDIARDVVSGMCVSLPSVADVVRGAGDICLRDPRPVGYPALEI
jgi:hypothetical protein